MQSSVGSLGIKRLIGAFAALSLSAGSAWAGGSNDLAPLQDALDGACTALQVPMTSCPQLPTATQIILEIAGLESAPLEDARFENVISPTLAINAVNPQAGDALNPGSSSFNLSNVSPLAFKTVAAPTTPPSLVLTVTQPGDQAAHSFFYAATNHVKGVPPTTLNLVYDYPPLTSASANFAKGQFVADISIPLVVRKKDGTENEAPTIIEIRGATGCGTPCVSTTVSGNFGSGLMPGDLGLTVTLTFGTSPNSSTTHAIFEVQAPLLVTQSNDLAYFQSDPAYVSDPFISFLTPAFKKDELGFSPKVLGGLPVGIAPFAAPQCTRVSCPPQPLPPAPPVLGPSNFPLCASIAADDGIVRPAVAAFFSIGTVGTTYLSAPLVTPPQVTCPF